jgi:aspartate oxidase
VPVEPSEPGADAAPLVAPSTSLPARTTMSRHVGVLRRPDGLEAAMTVLSGLAAGDDVEVEPSRRAFEATNLLTVALGVVASASARTESRGCHRRTDFPEPRDVWRRHLRVTLDGDGVRAEPEGG